MDGRFRGHDDMGRVRFRARDASFRWHDDVGREGWCVGLVVGRGGGAKTARMAAFAAMTMEAGEAHCTGCHL